MRLCLNRVTVSPRATGEEFIRAAHAAGFGAVELSARRLTDAVTSDPGVRDLLGENGVVPVHGGWSIRLHWDTSAFTIALPTVAAEMAFAASLGSRSGALVLPPAIEDRAKLVERIRSVAGLAADHGLDVVCEFIGAVPAGTDHAGGRACQTLGDALGIMETVQMPNAGILLDTFHWHASGGTAADLTSVPAGMPLVVHLNDAPPRGADGLGDEMRLLPGHGVIDLHGFLTALRARAYAGPLSVELKNPVLHAMSVQQAAHRAYAAAAAVLDQALNDKERR